MDKKPTLKAIMKQNHMFSKDDLAYNLQSQINESIAHNLMSRLEDKMKECMEIWGVDIDDKEQIAKRCRFITYPSTGQRDLMIDDKLALRWEGWNIHPFNPNKPFTIEATMKCSEIKKPSDYEKDIES